MAYLKSHFILPNFLWCFLIFRVDMLTVSVFLPPQRHLKKNCGEDKIFNLPNFIKDLVPILNGFPFQSNLM